MLDRLYCAWQPPAIHSTTDTLTRGGNFAQIWLGTEIDKLSVVANNLPFTAVISHTSVGLLYKKALSGLGSAATAAVYLLSLLQVPQSTSVHLISGSPDILPSDVIQSLGLAALAAQTDFSTGVPIPRSGIHFHWNPRITCMDYKLAELATCLQALDLKSANDDMRLAAEEIEQHKAAAAALRGQLKAALLRVDQSEGAVANPSPVKQKTLAKLHTALDEALTEGQKSQEALRLANEKLVEMQEARMAADQEAADRFAVAEMLHEQVRPGIALNRGKAIISGTCTFP